MRPVFTHEIQWYIEPGSTEWAGQIIRVSEDTEFEAETDVSTYDPVYKDRKNQPSYSTGQKSSVNYSIDHMSESPLQDYLYSIEGEFNVPCKLYRVDMFEKASKSYPEWKAQADYKVGDRVVNANKLYQATKAGKAGDSAPSTEEADIADGTVKWKYVGAKPKEVDGYRARMWEAAITPSYLTGSAGEALKHTGTIALISAEPTVGGFNTETNKFTKA